MTWWNVPAAALLGLALLATEARAAWLGAGVAALVLATNNRRQALMTFAAGTALLAVWLVVNPGAWARARSGGALTERVWTWRLAARIVADAPLAGTGPGTFRTQFLARQTAAHDHGEAFYHYTEYAHLEPLHVWVEVGAIGLGLFCWGLATALRGWWRGPLRARDPALWRGIG